MCFGLNEKGGAYTKDMKYFDDNNKMKYLGKKSFQKYPELSKALELISFESKNRDGKSRNKEAVHLVRGKKKRNKPEKILNDVLENVNKSKTKTNKRAVVEADDEMEQEGTQVVSQENTRINEAEEFNTEQFNQNPKKGSENSNTSFDENTFNYEIKIENTSINENIDIEEEEEIENTSTGTQTKEQTGFDIIQSSSQTSIKEETIRKEKSGETSDPSTNCGHDSCEGRNPVETDEMTVKITIEMSEATYARVAPMIPETCRVTLTSVPR